MDPETKLTEIASKIEAQEEEFVNISAELVAIKNKQKAEANKGNLNLDSKYLDVISKKIEDIYYSFLGIYKELAEIQLAGNSTSSMKENLKEDVKHFLRKLLSLGFVVEKQPQQQIQLGIWIIETPKVSFLCGFEAIRRMQGNPVVQIYLIEDSPELELKLENVNFLIQESAKHPLVVENGFRLNSSVLQFKEGKWNSEFPKLKITKRQIESGTLPLPVKRSKLNRKSNSRIYVAWQKYKFLFTTTIVLEGAEFELETISNSFSIVTHGSQLPTTIAITLWENAFGEVGQVPWENLATEISDFFEYRTNRRLEEDDLKYLKNLYFQGQNYEADAKITIDTYISKEMSNKVWEAGPQTCRIIHWFHEIIKLVGKEGILQKYWTTKGLIMGFISKSEAEKLLMGTTHGNFIIRFSETVLKSITVGVSMGNKVIWIQPWKGEELKITSLADRLQNLVDLKYVFGCGDKHELFGKWVSKNLSFQPCYFNRNQEEMCPTVDGTNEDKSKKETDKIQEAAADNIYGSDFMKPGTSASFRKKE